MCGILGFTGPSNIESTEQALNLISHRGPDSRGIFYDGSINLGHVRLSIIDIALGSQPMHSEDNRYVIVFNGEIYNYSYLKERLLANGLILKTNSDTEVLLYWMIKFGISGLSDLNGMFAFALWDKLEKKLIIARDRLGMKPLYYKVTINKSLIFSSEVKPIQYLDKSTDVNYRSVYQYLTLQNVLSSETFFKNVFKLPPGGYIIHDQKNTIHGVFWTPTLSKINDNYSSQDLAEKYVSILHSSVKRHLVSDVPIGSFLSGGIDSGLVSTLASKILNQSINTFTGYFSDAAKYDERIGSRSVGKLISSNSYEIEITQKDFCQNIETVMYHLEEPMLGTGALPQYIVSRLASEHVKVALTGHGGDESFAGYQVNRAFAIRESLKRLSLGNLLSLSRMPIAELSRVLYFLIYPLFYPEVNHGLFVMTPKRNRENFFTPEFLNHHSNYDPISEITKLIKHNSSHSDNLSLLYLTTYLPTLFLQEDKLSMAHSLESRMPLCDNEMIDFSLTLSLIKKMPNGELKGIPKQSGREILPKILYSLPKRGFPTPYARWFRSGDTAELISDLMYSQRSANRRIVNSVYAKKLFSDNYKSKTDNLFDYARANQMYSIAMVELWHRLFIDT